MAEINKVKHFNLFPPATLDIGAHTSVIFVLYVSFPCTFNITTWFLGVRMDVKIRFSEHFINKTNKQKTIGNSQIACFKYHKLQEHKQEHSGAFVPSVLSLKPQAVSLHAQLLLDWAFYLDYCPCPSIRALSENQFIVRLCYGWRYAMFSWLLLDFLPGSQASYKQVSKRLAK